MPLHSIIAYSIFFSVFGLLLFAMRKDQRLEPVGWLLMFILLTLFSGLRVGAGRDYPVYEWAYLDRWGTAYLSMEPLWQKAYDLFRFLQTGYVGMQLVVAGITMLLAFTAFRRLSLTPLLSLLCFVVMPQGYFESMNTVRQELATLVLMATFHLFIKKEYWQFLFWMLIAFMVHHSVPFFLLILLLIKWRYHRIAMAAILGGSLVVGTPLMNLAAELLVKILPFRYGQYILNNMYPPDVSSGLYLLVINGIALFFIWQYPTLKRLHRPTGWYIVMFFWAVVIYNSTLSFEVGMRLMSYPMMFIFPLIGNVYALQRAPSQRIGLWAVLLLFVIFQAKQLLDPNEPYIKYKTVFHELHYNPYKWP